MEEIATGIWSIGFSVFETLLKSGFPKATEPKNTAAFSYVSVRSKDMGHVEDEWNEDEWNNVEPDMPVDKMDRIVRVQYVRALYTTMLPKIQGLGLVGSRVRSVVRLYSFGCTVVSEYEWCTQDIYACVYMHTYMHAYIHTCITLPYLTFRYATLAYLTLH